MQQYNLMNQDKIASQLPPAFSMSQKSIAVTPKSLNYSVVNYLPDTLDESH